MMKSFVSNPAALAFSIRRFLPLRARAKRALLLRLAGERSEASSASSIVVTNIYDGGAAGLMCAVAFGNQSAPVIVVSIEQIAFDRRHPLSKAIHRYRQNMTKRH
jgi:hypothetical protein